MLSRKDYTVGWICALPMETAAARGMLDEHHPSINQPANDQNSYALGRIGHHNVVIACLPSNSTGIGSAAAVAAQMPLTFPSLRFCLMVGVGGGVPSGQHDIRLGDVVVSDPGNTHPGVIQYDSGKMLQDGKFERTGSSNRPPQILLTAVASIRTNEIMGPLDLSQHVERFTSIYANLAREVRHHGQESDTLFEANYSHQNPNDLNCVECDRKKLKIRPERTSQQPKIHYGLIASGNAVMKDSLKRDTLAQEHGILCFEMEAAGLMNNFPSLIIRGICDYCDSHKNKIWQPYAAVTAASYAKVLLGVVPAIQSDYAQPAIDKATMHNVPFSRNVNFVARDKQISELHHKVFLAQRVQKIALFGLGGVGKTQVALEMAYQVLETKKDCQMLWVVGTSAATLEQSYLEIADILGIADQVDDESDVKNLVKQRLSRPTSGKWLMIIDNADDIDIWFGQGENCNRRGALIQFLPKSSHGSVIFTTRDRNAAVKMAGQHVIEIQEMAAESARRLFEECLICKDAIDDNRSLDKLLSHLCYLPLALAQAAAFINANFPAVHVSTYLSFLDAAEETFVQLLSKDFEDDWRYRESGNPIATTWWISFDQIRRRNSLAAEYMSLMTCLEPDQIPESVIVQQPRSLEANEALGTLYSYSFITGQPKEKLNDGKVGSLIDMHRLVHLCTRNWLKSNGNFQEYLLETARRLSTLFPNTDPKYRAQWSTFVPHAYRVIVDKALTEDFEPGNVLMMKIGACLKKDGKYDDAEKVIRQALNRRESVLGQEHEATISSMNELTKVLLEKGKLSDAEILCNRARRIGYQVLETGHRESLSSLRNLLGIYISRGAMEEAERLGQQVLKTSREALGDEHTITMLCMHSLSIAYLHQGKYAEAESLSREAVSLSVKLFGWEAEMTIRFVKSLAGASRLQRKLKDAEALYLRILGVAIQLFRPGHPRIAAYMSDLAETYRLQGRYKEAEAYQLIVLEAMEKALGEDHRATLMSMCKLGLVYWSQGRAEEAASLYVQASEAFKRILGDRHPDTVFCMGSLALAYEAMGKLAQAEQLAAYVVQTRKAVLRPDHPGTLASMRIHAVIRKKLEDTRGNLDSMPAAEKDMILSTADDLEVLFD